VVGDGVPVENDVPVGDGATVGARVPIVVSGG